MKKDKEDGNILFNIIRTIGAFVALVVATLWAIAEIKEELSIEISIAVIASWGGIVFAGWLIYKVNILTNSVDKILRWINETVKNSPFSTNSPLALNETGGEMANDMAADDIIDAHENSLIKKLNALNIKNAYDVQVACLSMTNETWAEILAPEELDKIKKLAFSKGIKLENYYKVLGLKLRDSILSTRNEGLADVDKHS